MNRREFLRSTAAAGAAVVAAPLVALAGPADGVYPISVLGKTHFGGTVPLTGNRPCNYEDIVRGAFDGYKLFWT